MIRKLKARLRRPNHAHSFESPAFVTSAPGSKVPGVFTEDASASAYLVELPTELLQHIISFLDWDAVKDFSLLNHRLHDASNHRLWKRFRISDWVDPSDRYTSPSLVVRETCEAITRDPQRASYIKELVIGLRTERLGDDNPASWDGKDEARWDDALLQIGNALSYIPRLKVLDLSQTTSKSRSVGLCRAIVGQHARTPFNLRTIIFHDNTHTTLTPLLHLSQSLTCFAVVQTVLPSGRPSPCDPQLPSLAPGVMPHLEVYYGVWEVARQICRGRKLRAARINLNRHSTEFLHLFELLELDDGQKVPADEPRPPIATNVDDVVPLGEVEELVLTFAPQLEAILNRRIERVLGISCSGIKRLQLRIIAQTDTNSPFYTAVLPAFVALVCLQFVLPSPRLFPVPDKSKSIEIASVCASAVETLEYTSILDCRDIPQFNDLSTSHGFSKIPGVVFRRIKYDDRTDLETTGRNNPSSKSFIDTRGFEWVLNNWVAAAVNGPWRGFRFWGSGGFCNG